MTSKTHFQFFLPCPFPPFGRSDKDEIARNPYLVCNTQGLEYTKNYNSSSFNQFICLFHVGYQSWCIMPLESETQEVSDSSIFLIKISGISIGNLALD